MSHIVTCLARLNIAILKPNGTTKLIGTTQPLITISALAYLGLRVTL